MIDTQPDAVQVAARLRDLRDWASYFRMSLNRDFEWEPGRLELLASLVDPRVLEEARVHADGLLRAVRELVRQAEGTAF